MKIERFCRLARLHYSDLLDGQPLPWYVRLRQAFHLRFCGPCIRYHRSLAATRDALQALRDLD